MLQQRAVEGFDNESIDALDIAIATHNLDKYHLYYMLILRTFNLISDRQLEITNRSRELQEAVQALLYSIPPCPWKQHFQQYTAANSNQSHKTLVDDMKALFPKATSLDWYDLTFGQCRIVIDSLSRNSYLGSPMKDLLEYAKDSTEPKISANVPNIPTTLRNCHRRLLRMLIDVDCAVRNKNVRFSDTPEQDLLDVNLRSVMLMHVNRELENWSHLYIVIGIITDKTLIGIQKHMEIVAKAIRDLGIAPVTSEGPATAVLRQPRV